MASPNGNGAGPAQPDDWTVGITRFCGVAAAVLGLGAALLARVALDADASAGPTVLYGSFAAVPLLVGVGALARTNGRVVIGHLLLWAGTIPLLGLAIGAFASFGWLLLPSAFFAVLASVASGFGSPGD